jgi:chromosome segregation ATPase
MGENLKALNKGTAGRRGEARENKENSEGIKDKLNELKPEVVKLWAKADTLEDRLAFNERKLEEKMRVVSDLANVLKENNISRLEEKLKNLQTEIFTSIKELRVRVEGKVGQAEY